MWRHLTPYNVFGVLGIVVMVTGFVLYILEVTS